MPTGLVALPSADLGSTTIAEAWPSHRLRVADRGLREGRLVEMMREDGALRSWFKRRMSA